MSSRISFTENGETLTVDISEAAITLNDQTLSGDDENALRLDGATVTIKNATVTSHSLMLPELVFANFHVTLIVLR